MSSLASGCPCSERHEPGVGGALVHEDEPPGVYPAHALSESTSLFFVSFGDFGGSQRPFLKVHPSFSRTARLIVATDTLTPRRSCHSSKWRSSVASSFSWSCAHSCRRSSVVAKRLRLRPVECLGSTRLTTTLYPALDGRARDSEEVRDVSTRQALVHRTEWLKSCLNRSSSRRR